MSDSSSEDEDVMLAVAAYEITKREPRFWVHDIDLKREDCGEFSELFLDPLQDEEKFFKYSKMTTNKFFELLHLQKKDTSFRKSVCPQERLAVTLKSVGKADVASSSADSALSATCPGSSNERVIIKEEVEVDEESSINQSEQTEDEFMENWEQNDPCDDSNSGNTELGNSNYLERPVSPLEMKRCLKEEEAIKNQDLNNILRTTDIITGLNEMNSKQPKMPVGLMNNRGLHSSTELEDYLKTVIKKQEELININIELARFNLEKAKMEADINLQKMENLKLENQLLKFQLQKEKNNCHS